jgi:hypothetical protein
VKFLENLPIASETENNATGNVTEIWDLRYSVLEDGYKLEKKNPSIFKIGEELNDTAANA